MHYVSFPPWSPPWWMTELSHSPLFYVLMLSKHTQSHTHTILSDNQIHTVDDLFNPWQMNLRGSKLSRNKSHIEQYVCTWTTTTTWNIEAEPEPLVVFLTIQRSDLQFAWIPRLVNVLPLLEGLQAGNGKGGWRGLEGKSRLKWDGFLVVFILGFHVQVADWTRKVVCFFKLECSPVIVFRVRGNRNLFGQVCLRLSPIQQ